VRIGVLGAGAIGCYLGGRLQAAGHDVVLVGRARIEEELAKHGLVLTDYTGARVVVAPGRVRFATDPAALAACDAVLVTVKSLATESAAAPLAEILARRTTIVSFQNGVSNAPRLRRALPGHDVRAGMVPFNVAARGEGVFHNGTSGPLAIESPVRAEEPIARALRDAGFAVEAYADLLPVQWSKLLFNLNNSINALAGVPLREQLADRGYRRVLAACIEEGLPVVRAARIRPARVGRLIPRVAPFVLRLPDVLFFRVASAMVKIDPHARSSMLDDLERGRATEIDYLNGEILTLAAAHGLRAPVNQAIHDLVKRAEAAKAGSPRLSSRALLDAIRG
jgi:2-dehydropantoate 2-reductase